MSDWKGEPRLTVRLATVGEWLDPKQRPQRGDFVWHIFLRNEQDRVFWLVFKTGGEETLREAISCLKSIGLTPLTSDP